MDDYQNGSAGYKQERRCPRAAGSKNSAARGGSAPGPYVLPLRPPAQYSVLRLSLLLFFSIPLTVSVDSRSWKARACKGTWRTDERELGREGTRCYLKVMEGSPFSSHKIQPV
jgi:hypothetical protein